MVCSVSIVLGVLAAAAALKVLARRRFGRAFGGGYGRACGGGSRGFGRFRRGPLGFFLRRLDATPAQEKEIRDAVHVARGEVRAARDEAATARVDLAKSLAGEVFDDEAFGRASDQVTRATDRARRALREALGRLHATLDAEQRRRVVELLERGGGFRFAGGPYRG